MTGTLGQTPRPFLVYAAAHGILAAGLVWVTWRTWPPAVDYRLVMIAVAVIISEMGAVDLPAGGNASLSYPLLVASTLLLGPGGGSLVAMLSAVDVRSLRVSPRRMLFTTLGNVGQMATSYVVASWLYVRAGGAFAAGLRAAAEAGGGLEVGSTLPQVLVFALTFVALNVAFTLVGVALLRRMPVLQVWRASISWALAAHVLMGFVGYAIAYILLLEPLAFVLFAFPLVVARQLYQRYVQLRDAYLDTVRSLVAAIEAKDPYTRGHSERVAGYAIALGSAVGMPEPQVERLEFAALLHDLGKVGIRSSVLGKTGALSDGEIGEIREHPAIGAHILERVPYLSDVVPAIVAHHERYDGLGYGVGLAGKDAPIEARVLAVADSFDAMTTRRPYRDALTSGQALDELRRGAGSQFDPEIVDAFLSLHGAGGALSLAGDPAPRTSVEAVEADG